MTEIDPASYIITRRRKRYKFALFQTMANCYDDSSWDKTLLSDRVPLSVEVGAGSAVFLTDLAEAHPGRHYLAIDRKSDRLVTGARRASERQLNNITYLWSNAMNLCRLLPHGSIDELWLTFPDPWPQESNCKKRLTAPQFLAQYKKLLAPSGTLKFKTDNQALFDWSTAELAKASFTITSSTRDLHHDTTIPPESDARQMTTYEARYHKQGKTIYYLEAKLSVANGQITNKGS